MNTNPRFRVMSDPPDRSRPFTDREVGLILKIAAELQQRTPTLTEPTHGLSLGELEEIAAEAGIEREFIRRAVAKLDSGTPTNHSRSFIGAPTRLVAEREIAGEIPEAANEILIDTIRRVTGDFGEVGTLGRSLTWKVRRSSSFLHVTVTPRGGRTTIRIEHKLGEHALLVFLGTITGIGLIGGGAVLGIALGGLDAAPIAAASAAATALGASYLASRKLYRSALESRRQELEKLTEALAQRVEESIAALR